MTKKAVLIFSILFSLSAMAQIESENAVISSAGDGLVVGSSTLVRNDDGIRFRIQTSELIPGHAYSVWYMIFSDDFSYLAVLNADGNVANANGDATFAGHLKVGELPEVDGKTVMVSSNGVFEDPYGLNIRLVIRYHGDVIPGELPSQLTTYGGGCTTYFCYDPQFVLHKAN